MLRINRIGRFAAGAGVVLALGCGNLLEVSDPSRFTDEDLDQALDAVAAGAEGDLHDEISSLNNLSGLLGDELQHTGTWAGWDDIDHGRIRYDQDGSSDGGAGLLRARFASLDALARFDRLTGEGQDVDQALYAQVQATHGWSNLLLAQHFCEAPAEPGGSAVSDAALYEAAVASLTTAIATAQAAGATDFERWARAGRARAHLMLGNFNEAEADAQAIPDAWTYNAKYSQGNSENSIVNLSTITFNNAGGIRAKWWSRVDVDDRMLMDAFTNELDPRVAIRRDAGVLGVDGVTDFYSQWKYRAVSDDIPLTHSDEMRLIEAEVEWRRGNLPEAMTILNGLRTAAGLTGVTATTSEEVFDVLLNERFAELFMEGQRTNDLYRFELFDDLVAAGDFVASVANRSIKFPMDSGEAANSQAIENNASQRCAPTL
jgi:hypothetical protein